jgi:hypothetical protein
MACIILRALWKYLACTSRRTPQPLISYRGTSEVLWTVAYALRLASSSARRTQVNSARTYSELYCGHRIQTPNLRRSTNSRKAVMKEMDAQERQKMVLSKPHMASCSISCLDLATKHSWYQAHNLSFPLLLPPPTDHFVRDNWRQPKAA